MQNLVGLFTRANAVLHPRSSAATPMLSATIGASSSPDDAWYFVEHDSSAAAVVDTSASSSDLPFVQIGGAIVDDWIYVPDEISPVVADFGSDVDTSLPWDASGFEFLEVDMSNQGLWTLVNSNAESAQETGLVPDGVIDTSRAASSTDRF